MKAKTASSGRTAYRGGGSFQSSTSAYRDINRTLGNFYEEPKEDPEKEALHKEVEELRSSMMQQSVQPSYEEQVALLEKSYQLAAKYTSGENGATRETSEKRSGESQCQSRHRTCRAGVRSGRFLPLATYERLAASRRTLGIPQPGFRHSGRNRVRG